MNTLQERLGVAVESDAARYSGELFSTARGASIAGRVRRRRAVRAAGYGGGAMLAVGALAVGGTRIPWESLGGGLNVGAPGCVTASPSAATSEGHPIEAPGSSSAYTLKTTDGASIVTVVVVDGVPMITDGSGAQVE